MKTGGKERNSEELQRRISLHHGETVPSTPSSLRRELISCGLDHRPLRHHPDFLDIHPRTIRNEYGSLRANLRRLHVELGSLRVKHRTLGVKLCRLRIKPRSHRIKHWPIRINPRPLRIKHWNLGVRHQIHFQIVTHFSQSVFQPWLNFGDKLKACPTAPFPNLKTQPMIHHD